VGKPRTKRAGGLTGTNMDMTPMIDVVFNLLIFFIVCGQTASNEVVSLYLPAAEVPPDVNADPDRFIVNVSRDGHVIYRGVRCSPEELLKYLKLEALKSRRADKPKFSDRKILIRADQDTLYDFIQIVMIKCTEAGILNLQFGVKQMGAKD